MIAKKISMLSPSRLSNHQSKSIRIFLLCCTIPKSQKSLEKNLYITNLLANHYFRFQLFSFVDDKIHFFCLFSFCFTKLMFKFRKACVSFISFFDFRQIDDIRHREKLAINTRSSDDKNLIYVF